MKDTIIIHTLAVAPDWKLGRPLVEKVAEVTRWHVKERGWSDIAYAMLIDRDGQTMGGRDLDSDGDFYEETGAHARGWNKRSVGIALVGGKNSRARDLFSKNYTEAQRVALWKVIGEIEGYFGKEMKIIGHNEVSKKACPGFAVSVFLEQGRPTPPAKAGWFAVILSLLIGIFGGNK